MSQEENLKDFTDKELVDWRDPDGFKDPNDRAQIEYVIREYGQGPFRIIRTQQNESAAARHPQILNIKRADSGAEEECPLSHEEFTGLWFMRVEQ